MILLFKAHVKGHTRKDGVFVKDYDNKVMAKWSSGGQPSLFGAGKAVSHSAPKPPEGFHPKKGDKGEKVGIQRLSKPTPLDAFNDPTQVATVVPGGPVPPSLNGVAFAPWSDAPQTLHEWADVEGQNIEDEPHFDVPKGMNTGAGVIVQESDGRVWVVHPTNSFGGYRGTFPKGTVEDGLPMQASAIKEAYEESGLKVELLGHFMDVARTTSVARYYLARRVGGSPADAGWESQAVSLAPASELYKLLNRDTDHGLAEKLGAGPKPAPKSYPKGQGNLI